MNRYNGHTCHAIGCEIPVPPRMLMCGRHWRLVPREQQRVVWATYREGQCDDRRPSRAWVFAAREAIAAVARREGRNVPDDVRETMALAGVIVPSGYLEDEDRAAASPAALMGVDAEGRPVEVVL